MSKQVIFIDDEEMIRKAAQQALSLGGFEVTCYNSADKALQQLTPEWPGVVVTDIKMPGTDGLTLLKRLQALDEQLPVILVSGHADIQMAVKAIQDGAYDFVEKPFGASQLCEVVGRAVDKRQLVLDNRTLRAELSQQRKSRLLLGSSNAINELNQTLEYVAKTDADVLVFGETGTGKELVAQCLHDYSHRASGQFVAINCGAMPETIFESEIFGHVKGAFTSADNTQIGKLEYANNGTFFLDEIESLPINLQIKFLRVLQERKLQKLGSNTDVDLNMRVVAATKEDLLKASQRGDFREDLYYRLNVVTLKIPPLRDRKEDIPVLFQHFFDLACRRMNREELPLPLHQLQIALEHDWPGNVRELQNFAERAAIGIDQPAISPDDGTTASNISGAGDSDILATGLEAADPLHHNLQKQLDLVEKHLIQQELQRQKGSITRTYEALGVSRKTLYDKMKKHKLSKNNTEAAASDPKN